MIAKSVDTLKRYVWLPICLVGLYIWFLLSKNDALEAKLGRAEADTKLKEVRDEKAKIDDSAAVSLDEYRRARAAYLAANPPDVS